MADSTEGNENCVVIYSPYMSFNLPSVENKSRCLKQNIQGYSTLKDKEEDTLQMFIFYGVFGALLFFFVFWFLFILILVSFLLNF